MNLIEQLGGYEKAKDVFSQMKHSCERGYIEGKGVFYSYIGLQFALLEYRRQHNIFEVGDDVIFNNTLYKVIDVDDMHVHLDDGAYGFAVYYCDIKHAEGNRLP